MRAVGGGARTIRGGRLTPGLSLLHDSGDHGSFVERGSFGSSLEVVDEFLVIESDGVQEGGVQVVHVGG